MADPIYAARTAFRLVVTLVAATFTIAVIYSVMEWGERPTRLIWVVAIPVMYAPILLYLAALIDWIAVLTVILIMLARPELMTQHLRPFCGAVALLLMAGWWLNIGLWSEEPATQWIGWVGLRTALAVTLFFGWNIRRPLTIEPW